MRDFSFEPDSIREASRHRVMTKAVVWPLVGNKLDLPQALELLRKRFHGRLFQLKEAGWDFLQGLNYAYTRNCPPFGIISATKARCCHRPLICPFCYARLWVRDTFCCLERVIYGGTDPKAEPRQDLFLVALRKNYVFSTPGKVLDRDGVRVAALLMRSLVDTERKLELTRLGKQVVAARVLYRPSIEVKKKVLCCMLSRISFALLPVDQSPQVRWLQKVDTDLKIRVVEDISKYLMVKLVGDFLRYPVGMMNQDPDLVVELLSNLKHLTLVSSYGKARK